MQTQDKEFRQPLTRVALIVLCAVGMVVFIKWIPTSIGGPSAIFAPAELPSGGAQRIGAETALPAIRSSKARCPDCGVIESAREAVKTNETSRIAQCTDRDNSAAVTSDSYERAENADLAILLEWHMNARHGYSLLRREIGCSTLAALAAPLLIEPSKAFKILVRFRDGPSQILTEANLSAWRQRERVKEVNGSD